MDKRHDQMVTSDRFWPFREAQQAHLGVSLRESCLTNLMSQRRSATHNGPLKHGTEKGITDQKARLGYLLDPSTLPFDLAPLHLAYC